MDFKKTMDKAIKNCDDLKSDKEKAFAEYKEAKKKFENKANEVGIKESYKTQEFKEFTEKKRKCMLLGCRI